MSRRTETAYKAQSPGELAQHNPGVAKVGGLQSSGGKGEAVVRYREPMTTQDLEPSGFPARVNNMAKLARSFLSRRSSGDLPNCFAVYAMCCANIFILIHRKHTPSPPVIDVIENTFYQR
jgi:hypothetical protein